MGLKRRYGITGQKATVSKVHKTDGRELKLPGTKKYFLEQTKPENKAFLSLASDFERKSK